ncbi:MAG: FkbM family methyltransferase [Kofleriaceae bacterium]|nr:FkbM family methyltransferase [Kofleriaceae bacterium]
MRDQRPKLLRKLEARVRSRLGLPSPWMSTSLLGRELVVRWGTIRPETDYDDAWLYACLRHAEVVFDVGANVGGSALLGLLCSNIKQMVLIEANAEALSVAAQNLIRNQLSSRARFVGAFADETSDRTVDFWTIGTGAAGSMFQGAAVTAARAGSSQRVPTTSLDELAERFAVAPDFVKIDVEGAEGNVLRGARAVARGGKTRFLVEMHSPPELPMVANAQQVLAWCNEVGYAAWYLSKGVKLESPDLIAHRGRCHLLLQPAAWAYPEWLRGIEQSTPLPGS